MKLICIFKNNKLLDSSSQFPVSFANQFKENVAYEKGANVEDLTAVLFEDEDMAEYINAGLFMPKKRVEITRASVKLIELIQQPVTRTEIVDWKNCSEARISELFSPEEISKINENKAYYNSLGNEKHEIGFVFQWPHTIEPKETMSTTTQLVPSVVKEIEGVVL